MRHLIEGIKGFLFRVFFFKYRRYVDVVANYWKNIFRYRTVMPMMMMMMMMMTVMVLMMLLIVMMMVAVVMLVMVVAAVMMVVMMTTTTTTMMMLNTIKTMTKSCYKQLMPARCYNMETPCTDQIKMTPVNHHDNG